MNTAPPVAACALDRIPPELITCILSHLPIASLLCISRTSKALRAHVSAEPSVWSRPLYVASVESNLSFAASPPAPLRASADHLDLLAILPSLNLIPSLSLARLLPDLSRFFLLYAGELPRLTNEEWKHVCESRFMVSVMRAAAEREEPVPRGYWRGVFLKTVGKYEHTIQTGCSVNDHMCRYIVVHRKYGVTPNRMATREFNALAVFDSLKVQNSVTKLMTLQIDIPGMGTDVSVSAFISVATGGHSLVNHIMMDLLETLGVWRADGNVIVGPSLLTATVIPSPDERRPGITAVSHTSLQVRDFERVGIDEQWWACRSESK